MNYILGIGEYAIANNDEDFLITYALGSCVAVIMYCPIKHVAAMAHIAMPETIRTSSVGMDKPAYFADSAIPLMVKTMVGKHNCSPEKLLVQLVGGAESRSKTDPFKVGSKNVDAIKRLLREYQMRYSAEHVGGHKSRTVTFDLSSCTLEIKAQDMMI